VVWRSTSFTRKLTSEVKESSDEVSTTEDPIPKQQPILADYRPRLMAKNVKRTATKVNVKKPREIQEEDIRTGTWTLS
jgi:hypothetical protein